MTIPTPPATRRCFCLACQRTPLPGRWHCEYHERLNHEASLRASQIRRMLDESSTKTRRCRMGACTDPRLPEVDGCEACRRIGVRRRRAELTEVTA